MLEALLIIALLIVLWPVLLVAAYLIGIALVPATVFLGSWLVVGRVCLWFSGEGVATVAAGFLAAFMVTGWLIERWKSGGLKS